MPFDRSLYPPDWDQISRAVKENACWRCQFCGAVHRQRHPQTGAIVILTTAHLDHNPANNDPANLRALCQRCHNTFDAPHRHLNAAHTRRRKKTKAGQIEMFAERTNHDD